MFIMRLLKEEHKQIAQKIILPADDTKNATAAERLKCRMEGVDKTVELAFKKSINSI